MVFKMFAKFSVIGLSGVGVNMAVYVPLMAMGINYMTAAVVSFLAAVTNNFIWNLLWTFKGRALDKSLRRKYILFVACSIINLLVNLAILKVLVEQAGINATVAQLIAIAATGVLNFALNYAITFNDRRGKREEAATTHETCNYSNL
ncbi:GtrA-like protein [Sporomusa ovata DSM 2662]|uniref:Dolichyl-phosphate beta-D-mannosyltransferase n=1 Tax=Sporomusa ovata TaxID=2378 RepID=A0A0U1KXP4_9FIRM|nr:GtrA family protein [Sporomusa ovata]EQB28638.1 GtrA family protein [Sporomusa ovata DSM 2662]CQR72146.1 Dolichyl-phosphate beta-D-mannosyltransferase [Sporomusa ovata]